MLTLPVNSPFQAGPCEGFHQLERASTQLQIVVDAVICHQMPLQLLGMQSSVVNPL